jgi:hypothetical protein
MKKLLFLLLFPASLYGQPDCAGNRLGAGHVEYRGLKHPLNSIYVTAEPQDAGYGLRYNREAYEPFGFYVSGLKGTYGVPGTMTDIPHYKIATGITFNQRILEGMISHFSLGVTYHDFWGGQPSDWIASVWNQYDRYGKLNHWSFETGMGMIIANFWSTAVRVDFLRGEVNVDFGISF